MHIYVKLHVVVVSGTSGDPCLNLSNVFQRWWRGLGQVLSQSLSPTLCREIAHDPCDWGIIYPLPRHFLARFSSTWPGPRNQGPVYALAYDMTVAGMTSFDPDQDT